MLKSEACSLIFLCGGLNNDSQNVHALILRTCKYITLHIKKDFADVIQLRILRKEEIILDYPGRSIVITGALI